MSEGHKFGLVCTLPWCGVRLNDEKRFDTIDLIHEPDDPNVKKFEGSARQACVIGKRLAITMVRVLIHQTAS